MSTISLYIIAKNLSNVFSGFNKIYFLCKNINTHRKNSELFFNKHSAPRYFINALPKRQPIKPRQNLSQPKKEREHPQKLPFFSRHPTPHRAADFLYSTFFFIAIKFLNVASEPPYKTVITYQKLLNNQGATVHKHSRAAVQYKSSLNINRHSSI